MDNVIIKKEPKTLDTFTFAHEHFKAIAPDYYFFRKTLHQVVAYKNNEIIGMRIFKVRPKSKQILLCWAIVAKDERNKDINKMMFEEIEKFGKSIGIRTFISNIREHNIASLKSLLGSGFIINVNAEESFYENGDKRISLIKQV